jgi:hypothetical protein
MGSACMTIVSLCRRLSQHFWWVFISSMQEWEQPFVLMRNQLQAPIFQDPEYLAKYLRDGNGLNILLQNYYGDSPACCFSWLCIGNNSFCLCSFGIVMKKWDW